MPSSTGNDVVETRQPVLTSLSHQQHSASKSSSSSTSHQRSRRSVSRENFVETLVVADRRMVVYHGVDHIQSYVLTLMNIVRLLNFSVMRVLVMTSTLL
jgi:hypothetical protein